MMEVIVLIVRVRLSLDTFGMGVGIDITVVYDFGIMSVKTNPARPETQCIRGVNPEDLHVDRPPIS